LLITLDRLTLAPNAALAPAPVPAITAVGLVGPPAGDLAESDGSVRNLSQTPREVYVLTIAPAATGAATSPVGTPQANLAPDVTRAGASTPTQVPVNTEIVLATGDVAFAPSGVGVQWRNAGSTPATVLESGVAIPPTTDFDTRINNGTAVPGWTAGDVSFEDL